MIIVAWLLLYFEKKNCFHFMRYVLGYATHVYTSDYAPHVLNVALKST